MASRNRMVPLGKVATRQPIPVNLPSERKENAGQDPNVALVPKRGVWGGSAGGQPKEEEESHGNENDGHMQENRTAHVAPPATSGPGTRAVAQASAALAWGGAGLPARIQEQAEIAKEQAEGPVKGDPGVEYRQHHDGTMPMYRGHPGYGQYPYGPGSWENGKAPVSQLSHQPPPPPPPHPGHQQPMHPGPAGPYRDGYPNMYPPDHPHAMHMPRPMNNPVPPPPPGAPPPGPINDHPYPPRGSAPPAFQGGRGSHAPWQGDGYGDGPGAGAGAGGGTRAHPGFSADGNFSAKMEAMQGRPGGRRGPMQSRGGRGGRRNNSEGGRPDERSSSQISTGQESNSARSTDQHEPTTQPALTVAHVQNPPPPASAASSHQQPQQEQALTAASAAPHVVPSHPTSTAPMSGPMPVSVGMPVPVKPGSGNARYSQGMPAMSQPASDGVQVQMYTQSMPPHMVHPGVPVPSVHGVPISMPGSAPMMHMQQHAPNVPMHSGVPVGHPAYVHPGHPAQQQGHPAQPHSGQPMHIPNTQQMYPQRPQGVQMPPHVQHAQQPQQQQPTQSQQQIGQRPVQQQPQQHPTTPPISQQPQAGRPPLTAPAQEQPPPAVTPASTAPPPVKTQPEPLSRPVDTAVGKVAPQRLPVRSNDTNPTRSAPRSIPAPAANSAHPMPATHQPRGPSARPPTQSAATAVTAPPQRPRTEARGGGERQREDPRQGHDRQPYDRRESGRSAPRTRPVSHNPTDVERMSEGPSNGAANRTAGRQGPGRGGRLPWGGGRGRHQGADEQTTEQNSGWGGAAKRDQHDPGSSGRTLPVDKQTTPLPPGRDWADDDETHSSSPRDDRGRDDGSGRGYGRGTRGRGRGRGRTGPEGRGGGRGLRSREDGQEVPLSSSRVTRGRAPHSAAPSRGDASDVRKEIATAPERVEVNAEASAAAAKAATAAASADVKVAPQVFTQALAKLEGFQIQPDSSKPAPDRPGSSQPARKPYTAPPPDMNVAVGRPARGRGRSRRPAGRGRGREL